MVGRNNKVGYYPFTRNIPKIVSYLYFIFVGCNFLFEIGATLMRLITDQMEGKKY